MDHPIDLALARHLRGHPLTTRAALAAAGVTAAAVSEAVAAGALIRLGPSLLHTPAAERDPGLDHAAACLATGGIVCSRTAGMVHGLTDDLPGEIHVLVPHHVGGRPPADQPIRFVRSRIPASFTLGIEEAQVLGTRVRMTGRARTVIDLLRGDIRQHAVAAVCTFLSEGGDGRELDEMARPFGVLGRLVPLKEGVLEALSRPRGPSPG